MYLKRDDDEGLHYTNEFNQKVMFVFAQLVEIIDRNMFISHNRRQTIRTLLGVLSNGDRKRLAAASDDFVGEEEMREALQEARCVLIAEYGVRIGVSYMRALLDNGGDHVFLVEVTERIVAGVLSFRCLNGCTMEAINGCLVDFAAFLLRKIGSVDHETYAIHNGNYVLTLMEMLLRYARIPEIREAIFTQVSNCLLNFVRFTEDAGKAHTLPAIHVEILTMFLHLLAEMGESITNISNVTTKHEELLAGLSKSLPALRSVLPGHLHAYLNRTVEMFNL